MSRRVRRFFLKRGGARQSRRTEAKSAYAQDNLFIRPWPLLIVILVNRVAVPPIELSPSPRQSLFEFAIRILSLLAIHIAVLLPRLPVRTR